MSKLRQVLRPNPRLQKAQRDIRKQLGTYKSTFLARVDGVVRLPNGIFWVHDASGVDENGNTTYGAPRKMPMLPGAAIIPRPNTRVDVVTVNGVDYIARTNAQELERMGIDAHQSNTLDPAAQFKVLDWITNLQGYKTPGVATTHVIGSIYRKADGTYDVFRSNGGYDFVTANIPSTDMQCVVCQWLNTDTNTISATASSEISRDVDLKNGENIADTIAMINECVATAPTNSIGVNAWRIYDDTTISTLNDTNKLADLRGIIGVGSTSGGGGGGSSTAAILLTFEPTSDFYNGGSLSATTWTDLHSDQSFTVDATTDIIQISVSGNVQVGTNTQQASSRLVIDSATTPIVKPLGGGRVFGGDYLNVLAGAGSFTLTGLSAGTHTVKVQIYSATNQTIYSRPSTLPDTEGYRLQIVRL